MTHTGARHSRFDSHGSAFKRVKAILVLEPIADELGLNNFTFMGLGMHPLCPDITITREDLAEWAGLSISQYQYGIKLVRIVRGAVERMETSWHELSGGERGDLAVFRFFLARETAQISGLPVDEEQEVMGMTMAKLMNLASFQSV